MYIAAAAAAAAAVGGNSGGNQRGRRGGSGDIGNSGGSSGAFVDPSSTAPGDFFNSGYYPTQNPYGSSSYASAAASSNAYRSQYHGVGGNSAASYYPGMYNQLEEALPYTHSIGFSSTDDIKKINTGSSANTSINTSTE